MSGVDLQPIYTTLKRGGASRTEGITEFDKLPKLAQDYLRFLEKESGAKIGMVSTGPDRDQTMTLPEFADALEASLNAVFHAATVFSASSYKKE